jgi:magnesium transporter
LIGIVTVDDVLDVAEAEATEDIQKIGGVEALDEPFLQIPLARLIRKRANWLVILFFGELLTATAMGFFEKEIERAVVLALFVPSDYFQRWKFRLAGVDVGDPRAGA